MINAPINGFFFFGYVTSAKDKLGGCFKYMSGPWAGICYSSDVNHCNMMQNLISHTLTSTGPLRTISTITYTGTDVFTPYAYAIVCATTGKLYLITDFDSATNVVTLSNEGIHAPIADNEDYYLVDVCFPSCPKNCPEDNTYALTHTHSVAVATTQDLDTEHAALGFTWTYNNGAGTLIFGTPGTGANNISSVSLVLNCGTEWCI